ncbi:MAG: hypothetical protein ACN4GW_14960, partial [Desulforhopalus sp.]
MITKKNGVGALMRSASLCTGIVAFSSFIALSIPVWAASPDKTKPEKWEHTQGDEIPLLDKKTQQSLDDAQEGAT